MSFKYTFLACLILAAYEVTSAADDAKVDVTVFYETLDDRCVKFFTNNFKANFSDLLKFIDVKLVPFGKANFSKAVNGPTNISCDHGENECLGNRVHECAITNIPKPEDRIKFVVCTLEHLNMNFSNESIEECVRSLNSQDATILSPNIERCVADKNYKMTEMFSNMTADAFKTGVSALPAIILGNEQFNATLSSALETNFRDAVCQKLANTVVGISAICSNKPPVTPPLPPNNGSTPVTPGPHTTPAPGSATVNSVTYLPIVLAIIVLFNLKLH